MAIKTNEELQAEIDLIKNETTEGANTAERIGGTLENIKDTALAQVGPEVEESLTADYEIPDLTTEEKAIAGFERVYKLTANGFDITLPAGAENDLSFSPDSALVNYICLRAMFGKSFIRGFTLTPPDIIAPTFVSSVTNIAGTLITTTVDETVGSQALTYTKNGLSITGTPTIVGATVQFVPTVSLLPTDVILVSGTISDEAGNALTLSSQAVTNNVVLLVDLTFTAASLAITSASNIWTPTDTNSNYNHQGLDALSLAASADGYLQYKCLPANYNTGALGFSLTNALGAAAAVIAGFSIDYIGNIYAVNSGSISTVASVTVAANNLLRVRRSGSGFVLEKSTTNGASWTLIHTYAATSAAKLYVLMYMYGNNGGGLATGVAGVVEPKGYGLS